MTHSINFPGSKALIEEETCCLVMSNFQSAMTVKPE